MPATQARRAVFVSRFKKQQLVMERAHPVFDGGRIVAETPSKVIQFVDGRYETSDEAEVEFIRSRMLAPDGPDGLTEIDSTALAPDPSETLVQLATANAEQTRQILEAEQQEWQRPSVIQACEAKLAQFATRGPKKPD